LSGVCSGSFWECRVVQLWPDDSLNVFCVSFGKEARNI